MSLEINNLDKFLGKKVRNFRVKMRWPLKKLASELNISIQQVQRYEQGINKISASLLYEIAKIFNAQITCFFEGFEAENSLVEEKKTHFNVLLVEDNLQDEFLIRKALEDFPEQITIYTIHSGQQALEYFRDSNEEGKSQFPKPDLILLDIYLPGMKGFDILKDIKKRPIYRDIPVIMLTSNVSSEDVLSSYHLQASGFIRKSFSFEEFKDQFHKAFTYWTKTVTLPG
ncbi:response regulator [Holosporaceae bacterium 'Namur']|nr:response regulator [Holosporaceae bacterium 'Namur']